MEGVISVAANGFPRPFTDMVRACLKGDFVGAKALNDQLIESYDLLFGENNPAGVKSAMHELHLLGNYLRLPLVPLSAGMEARMKAWLGATKLKF